MRSEEPVKRILLVEDKRGMRTMLTTALSEDGWKVTAVADGERAVAELSCGKYDALLTDVRLPGRRNGLDILKAAPNGLPVVVMTAFGTIDMAVEAMKKGARDFISKPFELDDLLEKLRSVSTHADQGMLGLSKGFLEALARADRAAESGMNILISGESGTGKELLARRIHLRSGRGTEPFITVNCAAIPENLMESELFGAEKGAYTGSSAAKPGLFTLASSGVVFLDEIGDLGLSLQGKLLRILESGTYIAVGGVKELTTDALVVSASNRNLRDLTAEGGFREDLFYRISEFPVELPPLRERGSDVLMLASHFLEVYGGSGFTDESIKAIQEHSWPGNIRELRSHVRRACINSGGDPITPELLEIQRGPETGRSAGNLLEESAIAARKREREMIEEALKLTKGNRTRAAEILGVSYRTLMNKLREIRNES